MELTLEELKEKIIQQWPEESFLEDLGLTTEDLVEAFEDRILANREFFLKEIDFGEELEEEE
jgi:hypothetical protein